MQGLCRDRAQPAQVDHQAPPKATRSEAEGRTGRCQPSGTADKEDLEPTNGSPKQSELGEVLRTPCFHEPASRTAPNRAWWTRKVMRPDRPTSLAGLALHP